MSETTTGAARQNRRSTQPSRRGNPFARIGLWWRQIVAELRKVIWPTRKELVGYTIVTLIFSVIVIAIVFALDYGSNWAVLRIFS